MWMLAIKRLIQKNTVITRHFRISIELLISLAPIRELDVVLLPGVFPIETIYDIMHGVIERVKQPHRDLSISKRDAMQFTVLIHPETGLIVNIFIQRHNYL